MTTVDDERLAAACKALGHPARVRIVRLLAEQTECRGADVFAELPLAQSTVSEHLRVLKDAGVVRARTVGTSTVFCIDVTVMDEVLEALRELTKETACPPRCQSD
ncbi:MAG: hypothetical protein Kow0056_08310 [Coriobacteriia bacterium]